MLMVCTAFIMVSCAALYLIKRLDRNFSLDIMLMIVFIFGNIFGWFNATMIVGSITTKMIPSNLQCLMEGVRRSLIQISKLLASISTPLLFSYLDYWCIGIACTLLIMLGIVMFRKKHLVSVKEIILIG